MSQVNEIFDGFSNLVFGTGDKERTDYRSGICEGCDTRVGNKCSKSKGGCGCYIPAKVRSKDSVCPKGKW